MPELHDATMPPPPILRLARETVQDIGEYLEHSDLIALGRASRSLWHALAQHIETRIWGELVIAVPQVPACSPPHEYRKGTAGHKPWLQEETQRRDEICRAAMREKLGIILQKGGEAEERWGKVESIRLTPRSGSTANILSVIKLASGSLRSLTITGAPHIASLGQADYGLVGPWAIDDSVSFPCLTHVRLGLNSKPNAIFALRLCAVAPQLHSLEIDWTCQRSDSDRCRSDHHLHTPIFPYPTSLRKMLLTWRCYDGTGYEEDSEVLVSLAILRRSPQLQQLAIRTNYPLRDDSENQVLAAIRSLAHLQDLHCSHDTLVFSWHGPDAAWTGSAKLRRLVTRIHRWSDMFDRLIVFTSLERLYFYGNRAEIGLFEGSPPTSSHSQAMPSAFARNLRRNPHLRYIHTMRRQSCLPGFEIFDDIDEIERSGRISGYVSSIKHGDSELLCARLLHRYVEVNFDPHAATASSTFSPSPSASPPSHTPPALSYDPAAAAGEDFSPCFSSRSDEEKFTLHFEAMIDLEELHFVSRDGGRYTKHFKPHSIPTWQIYTDFDGLVVPLGIIQQMKEAEGAHADDWERRGVEVGDAAWAVLMEWHEEALALSEGREGSEVSEGSEAM